VVGLAAEDATARLRAAGFKISQRTRDTTAGAEDGIVLDQRPGSGEEIDEGSTVVLVVGHLVAEEDPQTAPLDSPPPPEGAP